MQVFEKATTNNGFLKWLIQTILVLGLITYPATFSPSSSYGFEQTRTELAQTTRGIYQKTVSFRKIHKGVCASESFDQTEDHKFCLFQCQSSNEVTLKSIRDRFPVSKEQIKSFLIHYFMRNSYASDIHFQRG